MEVGMISPYDLQKDFTRFYTEVSGGLSKVTSIYHTGDQIVRCYLRPLMAGADAVSTIKYWNMDGTPAAQFTLISGSNNVERVVDLAWSTYDNFIYALISVSGLSSYSVQKFSSVGTFQGHLIEIFQPPESQGWYTARDHGHTQIATSESHFYIKVGGSLYRYYCGINIPYDDGSLADNSLLSPDAFYPGNGVDCINLMYQRAPTWNIPIGTTPSGCLVYNWYDTNIQTLYLRSINPSGTMAYLSDRWAMLNVLNYQYFKYPLFMNNADPNALHYISCTATGTISNGVCMDSGVHMFKVFNVDRSLAAFINLNVSDIVMPAGSGDTSLISAHVINCWGEDLPNKLVTYYLSSGDGQVIAQNALTDIHGISTAIYTTSASTGTSQVTAVVNET